MEEGIVVLIIVFLVVFTIPVCFYFCSSETSSVSSSYNYINDNDSLNSDEEFYIALDEVLADLEKENKQVLIV